MRILVGLLCLCPMTAMAGNNLHLIESKDNTGFAIYRYSKPDAKEMKNLCNLGIDEVFVLSGDASDHEYKYASECPGLKVIYNEKQNADVPVTPEFLNEFDNWVQQAQASGKKIAFRCICGCHRTGRLAAYYQMKYQNLPASDSIVIMNEWGKWMFLHKALRPQVLAMEDYIKHKSCSQKAKYCVQ